MDDQIQVRTRPAAGAVLSVRVPREVANALDEYATLHGLTLSEAVRVALDQLLAGRAPLQPDRGYTAANAAPLTLRLPQSLPEQRTRSVAELRTSYGEPSPDPTRSR